MTERCAGEDDGSPVQRGRSTGRAPVNPNIESSHGVARQRERQEVRAAFLWRYRLEPTELPDSIGAV